MADKIKTLSQAIRLGATFRPKCEGAIFREGGSCALGAAFEAIGGDYLENGFNTMQIWDVLERRFGVIPFQPESITGRNDEEGWTREQIADWLEAQGL